MLLLQASSKMRPLTMSQGSWTRVAFFLGYRPRVSGLSAQIKKEKLMLVPRTTEGFRATVSVLQSLDGSKGVSFHTSLPEDRFVCLLVKNLGKLMPEDVREELENLGILNAAAVEEMKQPTTGAV